MPVYALHCPDCGQDFRGLVLEGTKSPDVWCCSQCKSDKAAIVGEPEPHPWEKNHKPGAGCPCCG
jgi:hypothetical protein